MYEITKPQLFLPLTNVFYCSSFRTIENPSIKRMGKIHTLWSTDTCAHTYV